MGKFSVFIEEDIFTKKIELSSMPKKTKTNIKNFNNKIDNYVKNYADYKAQVKKYILAKNKSFSIKTKKVDTDKLTKEISNLEYVKRVLNPTNTFFEKMGFDALLFDIRNYSEFNFNTINEIIGKFLEKFELAGIKLYSNDFEYTYYVREYMTSFLDVENMLDINYNTLIPIFEKIYWENPDLIKHIELNFRKLIKKYEKKFVNYINIFQKEVMFKNNINNYLECLKKLNLLYGELVEATKENVDDIIGLAKIGELEIKNFFKDSKVRESNYKYIIIGSLDLTNYETGEKFHNNLEKLKYNLEEYRNLLKFSPLFNDFKNEYINKILNVDNNSKKENHISKLKNIKYQIDNKESKLKKINKKIFTGNSKFFESRNKSLPKASKVDSIVLANELYILYKEYDKEMFKEKVLSTISKFSTISDLLHLYYSYEYFKKDAIKRVYNLSTYEEINKYTSDFDMFVINPNNIIINGLMLFSESEVSKIIINKYRLDNINIIETNLEHSNLNSLIKTIQFLLRVYEIDRSKTTAEKIWFTFEVEKLMVREEV